MPKFLGASMDKNSSRILFLFTLKPLKVVLQLANVGYGRLMLFALYDDCHSLGIFKQDIKPSAVRENTFSNFFVRMWQQPVLEQVWVRTYVVR